MMRAAFAKSGIFPDKLLDAGLDLTLPPFDLEAEVAQSTQTFSMRCRLQKL
jgi:hypothetical protein